MISSTKMNTLTVAKATDKFPGLVKKVKMLEVKNLANLLQASQLAESIFKEWFKLKRSAGNKKFNKFLYAEYQAQEEIIIGLAAYLNEKAKQFISQLL